jgi:beta propeller repeat protein
MTKGRGVVVAVVDTGLDFDHPDIAGNFWVNARETPGNGVDDDGNGFVDDVRGWDFPNNDADPMDDNREGHGTHVSGTIAAVAGNGEGIAGVAPEAKVMVVKAIGAGGSVEFSVAARAILYAISNGADVINCSWGPGPSGIIPLEIEDLVRFGHSLGVVFVFASANDSRVVTTQSPMNMKEILTVGASEPSDEAMPRSNWGRYLDVLAPGGSHDAPPPPDVARRSILSLKSSVFTDSEAGRALVVGERYVRLSGTSMAAPHVSGVAALVLAANPALTNEDVMNVVKASAASRSPVRFDLKEGYGRVDAAAAVALAGKKPPTVQLTAPAENLEIPVGGGTVAVRGKVCGDRLKEYQLFYGRMDEGNQLRPLGDATTTAVDGDIFSWDTSGLPPGCYALRLVATDFDGNRFEDMVQVTKSRPGIVRVQEPSVADAVVSERYVAWAAEKSDALTGETTWDVVVLNRRTGERSVVRNVQTSPIPLAVSDRYLAYCTKAGDADCIEVEDLELHTSYRIEDLRDGVDTLGISGRVVFWHDFEAGLFTCDIPSGRTTKVSGWASVEQPHVADGQAVWLTAAQNVAVCDLATGKVRLLTEDGPRRPKRQPRISGQRIVWLEGSNPNGEQVYDIILYDLRDDRPVFLASVRPLAQSLDISGDLVVWSDARNGNHDVYAYDLATNRESSVTTSGDVEALVCLASRTILWQRLIRVPTRPEGRYEAGIEMLDLSAPPSVTVRARR